MILALDTSTAACSAALFDDGRCVDRRDELIGRGHAERLVPMLAEMLAGRSAEQVLVGAGPGSFTGIRVGIAAAQGLAIGWNCPVVGLSSLALIAAAAASSEPVCAAMDGGHGELFVQCFDGDTLAPAGPLANLPPDVAAAQVDARLVAGPAAETLVKARGWGEALPAWPEAAGALRLPPSLRSLPARPIYPRAPDAEARSAA
jgi:tRNA threonylcarbamoyladenosine biosynthesis protein TsaB